MKFTIVMLILVVAGLAAAAIDEDSTSSSSTNSLEDVPKAGSCTWYNWGSESCTADNQCPGDKKCCWCSVRRAYFCFTPK